MTILPGNLFWLCMLGVVVCLALGLLTGWGAWELGAGLAYAAGLAVLELQSRRRR